MDDVLEDTDPSSRRADAGFMASFGRLTKTSITVSGKVGAGISCAWLSIADGNKIRAFMSVFTSPEQPYFFSSAK